MAMGVQLRRDFGATLAERLDLVHRAGAIAVELDGRDLLENIEIVRLYANQYGLQMASVCGGYRGWIGHFDVELRQHAVDDICAILRRCGDVGAKGIVVPAAYGMFSTRLNAKTAPRSAADDESVLLAALAKLDDCAGVTGTEIFLEPLNRYEDHMINTVEQAARLIVRGGFRHVRIAADTFHMNIEEADVEATIRRWRPLIGHIHLADSNRLQPGRGHFNFSRFLDAVHEEPYDGHLIIESSWQGPLIQGVRDSLTYLTNCRECASGRDREVM